MRCHGHHRDGNGERDDHAEQHANVVTPTLARDPHELFGELCCAPVVLGVVVHLPTHSFHVASARPMLTLCCHRTSGCTSSMGSSHRMVSHRSSP